LILIIKIALLYLGVGGEKSCLALVKGLVGSRKIKCQKFGAATHQRCFSGAIAENGTELGRLIDPQNRTAETYCPGKAGETLTNPETLSSQVIF